MIELHTIQGNYFSERLQERLKDLVVAHEVILHESDEIEEPFIIDGDYVFNTRKDIEQWFIQLEGELKWQRSLSGDGCYIDPNSGNIC